MLTCDVQNMKIKSVLVTISDGTAGEILHGMGAEIEAQRQRDVADLLIVFAAGM